MNELLTPEEQNKHWIECLDSMGAVDDHWNIDGLLQAQHKKTRNSFLHPPKLDKPNSEGWWQAVDREENYGCFRVYKGSRGFVVEGWGNEPMLVDRIVSDIKWVKVLILNRRR